jgi:hypothetical protein
MRQEFVTLSPAKVRIMLKQFWKLISYLFMDTLITLVNSFCKNALMSATPWPHAATQLHDT